MLPEIWVTTNWFSNLRSVKSLDDPNSLLTSQVWVPSKTLLEMPVSSVQSLSCVWLFVTPWIAARQAYLSITNSWSSLKLKSIETVMASAISCSVIPFFSYPQTLPASKSFKVSQHFAWGGQSTGVSTLASVFPKNTQGWSPLMDCLDLLAVQ